MIDFHRLAEVLLGQARALVPAWLPQGQLTDGGREWECGDATGRAGHGFKVNLETGTWADFGGDGAGGDLVSLYAAIHQVGQGEAAAAIIAELRLDLGGLPPKPVVRKAAPVEILSPAPPDAPPWESLRERPFFGHADGLWPYFDAKCQLLMVVGRYREPKTGEKTYRPFVAVRRAGRVEWAPKGLQPPRPLYRLDVLAAHPDAPVMVVEGEKAADAAQALLGGGWVVTTSPNGSKAAKQSDWRPLVGRKVVIWPDNDAPGRLYAEAVARRLINLAPGARVIDLDRMAALIGHPLHEGDDAADIPADHGPAILAALTSGTLFRSESVELPPEDASRRKRTGDYARVVSAFEAWCAERRLRPDALSGWRCGDQEHDDGVEVAADFMHEWRLSGERLRADEFKTACQVMIQRWRRQRRAELVAGLIGKPATDEGHAAIVTWVRALTGAERALDIAVMEHWVWNVKRLAAKLATEWDVMPILVGGQGFGKTRAIEKLCESLHELAFPCDAQTITDKREWQQLTEGLVAKWDEMAGASKADTEALKRALTATRLAFRELFTMLVHQRRRSCAFIGSSNLPLAVLINDPTGLRRWYQIDTIQADFDVLNTLDHSVIWRCVCETDPPPIEDHLNALRAAQNDLAGQDAIQLWQASEDWQSLLVRRADSSDPEIYPPYKADIGWRFDWVAGRFAFKARELGQPMPNVKAFALRLAQIGWTSRRLWIGSKREVRWFRPADIGIRPPQPGVGQGSEDDPYQSELLLTKGVTDDWPPIQG